MIDKSDHFVVVNVEERNKSVVAFCPEKLTPAAKERIRETVLAFHTKVLPHMVWEFWLDDGSMEPKFMTLWPVG